MIDRFDHAVIAVRRLEEAIERYRALGFSVEPGGRHTGAGTRNAIVRFGLDYLELISVEAPEVASQTVRGGVLVDFLQRREAGPLGYALATQDLTALAERLRRNGIQGTEPFAMERLRPDGHRLSWSLLVPEQVAWRRPWPFFIQWSTPDALRLAWEPPARHPNGALAVRRIAVLADDPGQARDLYEGRIGLTRAVEADAEGRAARPVTFAVGATEIELLTPADGGPGCEALARDGPGLYEVTLATASLEKARDMVQRAGVRWEMVEGREAALCIPADAAGCRLILTATDG